MTIDLEKVAKEWSRKRKEEAARTAGFWGGVALPIAGGGYGKKQTVSPFEGKKFNSVADLTRSAQVGDVLMVSHGKKPLDARKLFISMGTGLPHGYHAAVVSGVSKQKGEIEILDLTVKGYQRKTIGTGNLNNYSLLRMQEPAKRTLVVDNMKRLVNTQRSLNTALKRHGMSDRAIARVNRSMYAETINPVIGVRELFVPYVRDRAVHNENYLKKVDREMRFVSSNVDGIAKDMASYWKRTGRIDTTHLKTMQRVCTSIAASVGVPVGRTSNPKWSGPNDLLRSGKLKPVGYKISPKYTRFVKSYDTLLKVMPVALRGAAGVALGGSIAGAIATKQAIKRKVERRKARQEAKLQTKKQIHVKGHMREGKYVKSHTKIAAPSKKKGSGARTELGLVLGGAGGGSLVAAREKAEFNKWLKKNKPALAGSPWVHEWKKARTLIRSAQGAITGSALASILWGIKKHKERGGTKSKTAAPLTRMSMDDLQDRVYEQGMTKSAAIMSLMKEAKFRMDLANMDEKDWPKGNVNYGRDGDNTSIEGYRVKMRPGKGYNWLAKEMNKRQSTGGFGPLRGVTAKQLKDRMGGQMLYKNKQYSFDPYQVAQGKDGIGGGNTAKEDARAVRAGKWWRDKGRAKYLAKRKAKTKSAPTPKPPSADQVKDMNTNARGLSSTAEHLRDLKAHASVKHAPGKAPLSLEKKRRDAVANVRNTSKPPKSKGPLLRGTKRDASEFLALQRRVAKGQQGLHHERHRLLDTAHGKKPKGEYSHISVAKRVGRKVGGHGHNH